jgi:pseudaminic acid biosynthesis-associated methylase
VDDSKTNASGQAPRSAPDDGNVVRLETLWSGQFGDDYTDRCQGLSALRQTFWDEVLGACRPTSLLEVGCNRGMNLACVAGRLPGRCYGADINLKALEACRREVPPAHVVYSPARELVFRDRAFDLVASMGMLIHQPRENLPVVMNELVRCADRWVLCGEYYAAEPTEVHYRGQTGALFKEDYGARFLALFPQLRLVKQWSLTKEQGFDDVTAWLFERVR